MKRIYSLLLVGILAFIPIWAQQSDYYYYYKGERIVLPVDSTRLYVVSEGELQTKNEASANIRMANYNIKASTQSYVYNLVVPLQQHRSAVPEVYFSTLEVPKEITSSQYVALIEKMRSEDNVWQVLPSFSINGEQVDVTNNFYVKLKSEGDFGKLQEMASQYNIEIIGHHEHMPLWYILSCNSSSALNSLEAANLFYTLGRFECSEPELHAAVTFHSDDPNFINQWNLKNTGQVSGYPGVDINVEEAWEITKGDGTIVAIYDEAISTTHSDLSANILVNEGYDINTGTIPIFNSSANNRHGMHSAGVIAAVQDNGIGLTGVAPESKIVSIACSAESNEDTGDQNIINATPWEISLGFTQASEKGVDVINCPWSYIDTPSGLIDNAINSALDKCVIVFAAGNYRNANSNKSVRYPANCNPRILTVGGITNYGSRLIHDKIPGTISSFGSRYGEALDVVAPAVFIYTTHFPDNTSPTSYYNDFRGTSAACAHVSAIAALILSAHPELTPDQVVSIIEYTARKIRPDLYTYQVDSLRPYGTWNEEMGYGLVDAGAAVRIADKASRTTYIRDMVIGFERVIDYDIEIENIVVTDGGLLDIDKERSVFLKRNVHIEKGGTMFIHKDYMP